MKEPREALDFVTRVLARDRHTGSRDTLRAEIRAGTPPWEAVVSLANKHLLTPALWVSLSDKGLADELPEDLHQYLQELHRLSTERNRHLRQQLLEAVRQLNTAGIVPVLLKGAKHLVTALYDDPGVRIMSDLDLLVSSTEIAPAQTALQQLGYQPIEDVHDDYHAEHHHCAPLYRDGDYAMLEIHRGLAESPFDIILPVEMALTTLESFEVEGARMTALSTTHRILHNIIHGQLVDHLYADGIIPLRSLHEIITESASASAGTDWHAIMIQVEKHSRSHVLNATLYMAHSLFAMPYPVEFRPTLASRLHYRRCRSQLAWRQAHQWGLRLGRYSSDRMNERYACGHGWLAVNRSRLRRFAGRFATFISDSTTPVGVHAASKRDKA